MEKLTALNQVMRDIEQHYPNLFDLNTAQGREFVGRFYKYLEMEKEQIIDAIRTARQDDFWEKYKSYEDYYNETFSNTGK